MTRWSEDRLIKFMESKGFRLGLSSESSELGGKTTYNTTMKKII